MIRIVPYRGWYNNLLISNGNVEIIVTLEVGPRVICYRVPNCFNVMKNYEDQMGKVGEAEWCIRGGLRFWLAPEDLTRTYYPDNKPVSWKSLSETQVLFTPPPETEYGVQKEMMVTLDEQGTGVSIQLRVTNIGTEPTRLAPWAPTVMAPGGREILPQPSHRPHPGHPKNARSPADFAPSQSLVLWPYFDFTDPRWTFTSRYIFLDQDARCGPTKIGFAHPLGWACYWNQGTVFVKKLPFEDGAIYPDMGTNYQTFSNEDMLEMETVGTLGDLQPGAHAELKEHWRLFENIPPILSENDVDRFIIPLLG